MSLQSRLEQAKKDKESIEANIAELEAKIKKTEYIKVPEEIKIHKFHDGTLRLLFGNNQMLYSHNGVYGVTPNIVDFSLTLIPCHLEPCEEADLKLDNMAFRTDYNKPDFSKKTRYCFILKPKDGNDRYAFVVDDEYAKTDHLNWKHWYRVVPD
jgi:hypothetical protein